MESKKIKLKVAILKGNEIESNNFGKIEISEDEYFHFNKKKALNILEKNIKKLDIDKIVTIRYFDQEYQGWIKLSDKTMNLKDTIKLLIEMNENNEEYKELKKKINQKIKSQEEKLKLETTINSTITRIPTKINNNLDICLLFSNPLIELDKEGNKKSLKTIYDFIDNVADISDLIETLYINFEINIGTIQNLKRVLDKKTKILHIICKSSYDLNGNICLEFENNNCELERIDYNKLKEIFSDYDEFKKSNLIIINTEFAEEILDLFQSLDFENIIVEHTTVSTINLTKKFNYYLYDNLIFYQRQNFKRVEEAFDNAKSLSKKPDDDFQICCCFHKHNDNCEWKKKSIENKEEAHFSHLKYKCNFDCRKKHKYNCDNIKKDYKINGGLNLCCCNEKKDHDINSVIMGFFSKEDFIPFIEIYNIYPELNLPNYNDMKRLIGLNNILYEIFNLFFKKEKYHFINVYFNEISDCNIFALNLTGFLIERINNLKENNEKNKIKSIEFIELKKSINIQNINFENGKIYILNPVEKDIDYMNNNLIKDFIDRGKKYNLKTVLVSNNEIIKNNDNKDIKVINVEKEMDQELFGELFYINKKGSKTKKEFDKLIEKKKNNELKLSIISIDSSNEKEKILQIQSENEKIKTLQEIISLFQFSKKGLFLREISEIYKEDYTKIIDYLRKDLKNIILEKNKLFIYNENKKEIKKILQEIKENNIEKLIQFYSNTFRTLLNSFPENNSFTEFSAGQNFGIWKSLKENDEEIISKEENIIKYIKGDENLNNENLFHKYHNFKNFFTLNNLNIIYQNKKNWNRVHDYIEDLTINFTSFMKIIKNSDFELRKYSFDEFFFFDDLFETFPNDFPLAYQRMKLFKQLFTIFGTEKSINDNNLEQLNNIYDDFKNLNCILGQIEIEFSKGVAFYKKSKDFKKSENYLLKTKELIGEFENDNNSEVKKNFLLLYKKKIDYIIIKYKIKENICDENDINILKELILIFSKFQKNNLEIKTYKLLSELYWKKYKLYKYLNSKNISYNEFVDTINEALDKCKKYNRKELNDIINKYIKSLNLNIDKFDETKNNNYFGYLKKK